MMQQKHISGRDLSKTLTSEDILGKDVIDFDGSFIGSIEKVFIDHKKMEFVGVSIDRGFLKRGLTIGKDYIGKITRHAVFLKIKVSYEVKGKIVFDNDGRIIGKVSSIELYENKNKIVNILVRPRLLYFGKDIIIPVKYINAIGDNVMLNIERDKLKKNVKDN